ncbi:MAG: hypothetical protein CMG57_08280 [Candidatus Marinimicrobia bacterium]|nr:hypothetical protein [Candidatus Neomarinimicrobiota bacterium]|tara:strand:+ start:1436 stop:2131 length:696 start_codon:yes stop_codon:yes gene_type:complete
MDATQEILNIAGMSQIYSQFDVLINLSLSIVLGLFISYVYKYTHKGVSYSQSFMLTIVFVTIIVAMVMMIIGNNIARAFALVGALSIIRFRTVIKDTKDTAFVFLALAAGMASGTASHFLAIAGTLVTSIVAYILYTTNYGSIYSSEFILRFRLSQDGSVGEPEYVEVLNKYAQTANLLHIEPSGDSLSSRMTFDVMMRKDMTPEEMSTELSNLDEVSELIIVASEHDIDY